MRLRRAEPALPVFAAGARVRPLVVRRIASARRMRLVVDPRSGEVRLTLPRRAALGHALAWAEQQRDWVEQALADLPPARPIVAGATIPFEDRPLRVEWRADWPRRVTLREAEGVLCLGGAEESIAPRVLRWLRGEALARLERETRVVAARAGVTIGQVRVGDPRSRWGSCSASGDVRYSWRLILAPPAVREATVVHEVAHRLHMDHGPRFHAAVARLLGREPAAETAWLRAHGAALYWLGRAP